MLINCYRIKLYQKRYLKVNIVAIQILVNEMVGSRLTPDMIRSRRWVNNTF